MNQVILLSTMFQCMHNCVGMKVGIWTDIHRCVELQQLALTLPSLWLQMRGPWGNSAGKPLVDVRMMQTTHHWGLCDRYRPTKKPKISIYVRWPSLEVSHHATDMLSSPPRQFFILICESDSFQCRLPPPPPPPTHTHTHTTTTSPHSSLVLFMYRNSCPIVVSLEMINPWDF